MPQLKAVQHLLICLAMNLLWVAAILWVLPGLLLGMAAVIIYELVGRPLWTLGSICLLGSRRSEIKGNQKVSEFFSDLEHRLYPSECNDDVPPVFSFVPLLAFVPVFALWPCGFCATKANWHWNAIEVNGHSASA